ncbi:tRNA pseudouridine(55) synthase TruB [Anoxybacterium hadale]|uniref:tRNA pseudouridine(55) synthase TruB n=1 Tax=Anoxybacterium hadale TaxID=3408580 RepID=A0ACD1A803_9FIRM|nr:tRNA pseudouridine(55) synthase TruB [Clostridiales bacterium]
MIKDGIINLLKPAGMTSHDGVQFLRRLTGIKRIGHTGTLDPMAVGVLPLCIGSAARITEYLDLDYKKYRCEMQLGLETDTQDIWGTAIQDRREAGFPERAKVEEALFRLRGVIYQYPPGYSAVRVNGKRLYEYARQGEEVEIKARKVEIKDLTVISYDSDRGRAVFDVTCSKGTYIRTICHDTGTFLGCGAVMSSLIRTASGAFELNHTVTLEELKDNGAEPYLLPPDFPLVHFGQATVSADRGKWFANGGHLRMSEIDIIREPEFKNPSSGQEGVRDIREEYRSAYNIYLKDTSSSDQNPGTFLGVAFYSPQYKKLVGDKIFLSDRAIFDSTEASEAVEKTVQGRGDSE